MAVLWFADLRAYYESPRLLLGLNFVFSTLASLLVAYLIGRSFLVRGKPELLLLGCGVIIWGAAALVGIAAGLVWADNGQLYINVTVTIHNICVWLSALCHLIGAVLSLRPTRALHAPSLWLAAAYAGALTAVGLVTLSAHAGWTPIFFIQGQGGTPVRHFALGTAIAMFVLTAILLTGGSRRPLSAFRYWYTLALALIAAGLFGIMIESVHASLLSWTGRTTQFLSGVYMLVAAVASVRESRAWEIPLEEALYQSEERLRLVLQASSIGTFEIDLLTEEGQWNAVEFELLGLKPGDARPSPESFFQFVHPDDVGTLQAQWEEALHTGTLDAEFRVVRADGQERWLAGKGQFAFEGEAGANGPRASGRALRFLGVNFDITERKRAEEGRRLSEERLSLALRAAQEGVWDWNLETKAAFYSSRYRQMLGYTEDEIAPTVDAWERLLHPEDQSRVRQVLDAALRGERECEIEFRLRHKDGHYVDILSRGFPVRRDSDGAIIRVVGTHIDLTEPKRAEEALRKTNAELTRFNRVAVDRESRMIELKKQINALCDQAGLPRRFPIASERLDAEERP